MFEMKQVNAANWYKRGTTGWERGSTGNCAKD